MSVSRLKIAIIFLGVALVTPASAEEDLVPFGSEWLYFLPLTEADFPSVSFENNWIRPDFDTTNPAWSGPAPGPFQYGGISAFDPTSSRFIRNFATELPEPESGSRYTTYFRHTFNIDSAASNLGMEILAEDGVNVYLDGEQILNRRCCLVEGEPRLPDEPDEFLGLATMAGNERVYERFFLPDSLAAGEHTLAVAVHQFRNSDRDMGFSMRLFKDVDVFIEPGSTWSYFEGTEEPSGGTLDWATVGFDDSSWPTGEEGFGYDTGGGATVLPMVQTELLDMQNNYRALYLRHGFTVTDPSEIGELVLNIDHDDSFFAYVNGQYVGVSQRHPNRDDPTEPIPFDFAGNITSHESSNADGSPGEVYTIDLSEFPGLLNAGENILAIQGFNTDLGSSDFFVGQVRLSGLAGSGPGLAGDFDGNGVLDAADINLLSNELASGGTNTAFDVTGDGQVTTEDHAHWVDVLKNTYPGDANLDGEFNSGDLVAIFRAGKFEQDVDATWEEGDWNHDLRVGSGDLVAAFRAGGFEQGPRNASQAVPEPSALTLCLLALLGTMSRRLRC